MEIDAVYVVKLEYWGNKQKKKTHTNNQQQTKTITIIVDMLGVEYPCIKWKGKKDNEKKKKEEAHANACPRKEKEN